MSDVLDQIDICAEEIAVLVDQQYRIGEVRRDLTTQYDDLEHKLREKKDALKVLTGALVDEKINLV